MATVTVLGAGMMGSAFCLPAIDNGHEVRLVGTHLDGEVVASLRDGGDHPKLKYPLPAQLSVYPIEELDVAMKGVDIIGVGVSSQGVRWAGHALGPYVSPEIPMVMITKGLEWNGDKFLLMPDVLSDALPLAMRGDVKPCAIAGPCIAGELARREQTCVVLTGREQGHLDRVTSVFATPYYHIFPSSDVVGVEVCAALKNAYALAIAFSSGIHEGRGGAPGSVAMHNYESAVFAQAALEMQQVVTLLGGEVTTVLGLPGVGDLDVTCNGGRTGRFGRWLGTGLSVPAAIEKMEGATLECIDIIRVFCGAFEAMSKQGRLGQKDLPMMRHLGEVVLGHKPLSMPFAKFFKPLSGEQER